MADVYETIRGEALPGEGQERRGYCLSTDHADVNTPSCDYNAEKQVFHCKTCGIGGNVIVLVTAAGKAHDSRGARNWLRTAGLTAQRTTSKDTRTNVGIDSPEYPHKLEPHHRRKLFEESGIDPKVAAERGYISATADTFAKDWAEDGLVSLIPRLPGLVIPIYNAAGVKTTLQLRPDAPRGDAKYVSPKKGENEMRLDTHPRIITRLADKKIDLWITEGILKADSAISRGLCCIGILGVWMAFRKNSHGGVEALPGWDSVELRERNVYIAFDSDIVDKPQVRKAMIRLRTFLQGRGAFTRDVRLPCGCNGDKVGLDDYFVAGHTVDDLYALVGNPNVDGFVDGGRPAINAAEGDLSRVTADTLAVLRKSNDPVRLMMSGGRLVRFELDERDEAVVRELSADGVRHEMGERIAWYSIRDGQRSSARPPREVAVNVLETPELGFPVLKGTIAVPTFRPDGSLLETPGYDLATGLYFQPAPGLEIPSIPEAPNDAEVTAARSLILDDLLVDFPFVGDADRAHAFALALLPFARELIVGATPLHVIDAPTHGSGKGKLARTLLTIGRIEHPTSTPWPRSEEEIEKRLLSFLASGTPSLIFDNVTGIMNSPSLCLALTEPTYVGRILGKTYTPKFEVRTIWAMTSNNATLHKDITRRAIPCRIDAKVEKPFQREGFKHPQLEQWARENRSDLLGAALVLVKAWIVRGRPASGTKPLGSYEAWTHVMGGICEVAGVAGFLTGLDEFYAGADSEQEAWAEFFAQWFAINKNSPMKARNVFSIAESCGLVFPNGSESQQVTRLGKQLRYQRDRIIGGYQLVRDPGSTDGSARWICQRVSENARVAEDVHRGAF
jgi:hypothetical protein